MEEKLVTARLFRLISPGQVQIKRETIDPATLGPGTLLCETLFSAISPGTEMAAFDGAPPLRRTPNPYPRWLGYMNVARVLATGPELRASPSPGSMVYSHAPHRSHFVLPAEQVLAVLPNGVAPALASVAYLYRLGWSALRRAGVRADKSVVVVGIGAIGLATVEMARLLGCATLAVSDQAGARALAQALGAQVVTRAEAATSAGPTASSLPAADLIVLTTNGWEDLRLAMRLAAFNGVVTVLGFPGRGLPPPADNPLASELFYDRQLTLTAAGFAPELIGSGKENPAILHDDIRTILQSISEGRLDPNRLIRAVVPADELQKIYASWSDRRHGPGTVVLDWSTPI